MKLKAFAPLPSVLHRKSKVSIEIKGNRQQSSTFMTLVMGFTLIEILVSLAVISTVSGLVLINYNNFNQVERLRQAGKNLRNDMRSIQTKAASGVKPVGVTCTRLLGYQMNFNTTSYNYQPLCTEGLVNPIVTVSLPPNVEFNPVPLSVKFNVLTGTTDRDAIVTMSTMGRDYHVQVSPSGDISDIGTQQIPESTPVPTQPESPGGHTYPTLTPTTIPTLSMTPTNQPIPTNTPTLAPTPTNTPTVAPTPTRTPTPIKKPCDGPSC